MKACVVDRGVVGLWGIPVRFVEPGIAASAFVPGLLVAAAAVFGIVLFIV